MPFNWREFLILAHSLRNDASEGVQRTCLGRAYYYTYNLGLAKARTLTFDEPPPGLHRKLWSWCQKQTDRNIRQMGVEGSRMHALRVDADYKETSISNLADEVGKQLARAQTFERLVAQSNGQPAPPALAR
jgi:hypothetical protein